MQIVTSGANALQQPNLKYKLKSKNPFSKKEGDIICGSDLPSFYEECLLSLGFKNSSIFNSEFFSRTRPSDPFNIFNRIEKKGAKLSTTGSIPIGVTTVAVTDLLKEVGTVVDEGCYYNQIPDVMSVATTVVVDTWRKIKGAMKDRKPNGQPFDTIEKIGFNSASFQPGYFGEKMVVTEQEITNLREIGTNNYAIRGIAQYMAVWTEQAYVRMYTKNCFLKRQALFDGNFTWEGNVFSFGVPALNTLAPVSGVPWATVIPGPPPSYFVNPAAKPLTDMRYAISQDPNLRRLKKFLRGVIMNRVTHDMFYQNPEVQQLIQYGYMANTNIVKKDSRGVTMAETFQYFLGGDLNVEVHVDDATYISDESDPFGFVDETANYLLPDGYILFYFDLAAMGGQVADFVYTPAIQNGGFLDARPGAYMAIEDLTAAGSYGGLENPSLKLIYGFNGMPRIKRPVDLFTLKVFF